MRWWQAAQSNGDGNQGVPAQLFKGPERLFQRGHRNNLDMPMTCVIELLAELVFAVGQFTL